MSRLTVAQALVRFLAVQEVERDGERSRFFAGCFGIFGHGNVAGLGQALHQYRGLLPYHPARNEQAMVHIAAGYARQRNRLGTFACTTSVGPGATNMVTGAALATINRLPVLLLPGDTFATRTPHPVLQQLEVPCDATRVGQRLLPARVALLRAGLASRAADPGRARGDARAHRSGRDRARSRWRCPRTCRPRRSTCPTSSSSRACGRCTASRPRRRRSRGRWS